MISSEIKKQYIPAIGIECHVQLKTKTKLFAAVGNDARDAAPNTLISHICLGMPGALPVLNRKAVEYAAKVAFAFGIEPQTYSYFERKHYFYPDLPKGYQITQLSHPIIKGGKVDIEAGGETKTVRINRVQIEEDAGKSTHPTGKDYSLVDLNRAGTPLLEIVSEADMQTAEQAKAYVRELWLLMRYTDVSDADLYYGNMRFDVNVSVSKDPARLGLRTETKNLNSFRSVEKAVEYEIDRQIELLEKGQTIVQETRGWDDAKQKTFSQRSKEDAHDYRYFPEPDVPPIELSATDIATAKNSMPVLPHEWRQRLASLGLNKNHIETLLDAEIEHAGMRRLPLIEAYLDRPDMAKAVANWLVNVEIPLDREGQLDKIITDDVRAKLYGQIYVMVKDGQLSSTNAKALITAVLREGVAPEPLADYAKEKGLIQMSDSTELEAIVSTVLAEHPAAAEDVKNGQMQAIGFLVGQVMKLSRGAANPSLAQELIKKQLGL